MLSLKKIIPFVALLITPLTSCSKNSSETSSSAKTLSQTLLEEPLLKKIPDSTAGFFVMNFSGEGYTKLNATDWAKEFRGLNTLKSAIDEMESRGAPAEQLKLAKAVYSSLQKLGIVSTDGRSQVEKVVSSAVAYLATRTDGDLPVDIGILLSAARGASLAERLPVLRDICREAGLTISDRQVGNASGFSASLPSGKGSGENLALLVAATSDLLSITLKEDSALTVFSEQTTRGLDNLQALPDFARIRDAIKISQSSLAVSFVSLSKLLPMLSLPDSPELSSLPLTALGFEQGYSSHMETALGVSFSPKTDEQKEISAAFEGARLPSSALQVPSDTAASLSLDLSILGRLQPLIEGATDPNAAMALQQIKNIGAVTFGVRNSDGATPIPDLFIALESPNRAQVLETLEGAVGLGLMSAGQQPQWLSKDIGGAPTRYLMTPLGVGLYLASPPKTQSLILATSEQAVADIADPSSTRKQLSQSIAPALRESIPAQAAGSFYINGIEFANVLNTVKSTVASMVGPNPDLEKALDSERVKQLGVGLSNLSFANGVFKFHGVFEPPQPH